MWVFSAGIIRSCWPLALPLQHGCMKLPLQNVQQQLQAWRLQQLLM
jgi:hypothetical protein